MNIEHKANFILITDILDNQFIKEKFIGYTENDDNKEREMGWRM